MPKNSFTEKLNNAELALTFDDVLILPSESKIEPGDVDISTKISRSIQLSIPILSAAMDTVTEAEMAIKMASLGGLGVIHRNMSIERQVKEVEKVKRANLVIEKSFCAVPPDLTVKEAKEIMDNKGVKTLIVVKNNRILGILTTKDVRFEENAKKVEEVMSKDILIASEDANIDDVIKEMEKKSVSKVPIIKDDKVVGIITTESLLKGRKYPLAVKDAEGRLVVAAAIGPFDIKRAKALKCADILVIDCAHAHNRKVINYVAKIKREVDKEIIVGNLATKEAAEALISAEADTLKVGVGPGSICTTRIVAGAGVPQLTAIAWVADVAKEYDIPVIADGGIRSSGDIVKALAVGADACMLGYLLAGTDEAPGKIIFISGRKYKQYRGMGSLGAMLADRYLGRSKFIPEGVEGLVPYRGSVEDIMNQIVGGIKAGFGYAGAKNIKELKENARFVRITSKGLRESKPHDILITDETYLFK